MIRGYISYTYYFVIKMIFKDLHSKTSHYSETLIYKRQMRIQPSLLKTTWNKQGKIYKVSNFYFYFKILLD